MSVFIIRRLLQSTVVMLVMSGIIFVGVYLIGSPVDIMVSPDSGFDEIERVRKSFGLDKPLWEQYLIYMGKDFTGDLGTSFLHNEKAMKLILERFPATMELALVAMFMAIFLGIPLGIIAGLKPDSLTGRGIMAGSIMGFSLPTFWVGIMMIMIFSVELGWLPSTGRGDTVEVLGVHVSFLTLNGLSHLILPATNLALFKISLVIRLTRAGVRETLTMDFIKFARAKGLSPRRVIFVHLLKNILIPVVTVLGLELGSLIAFSVVTETIFAWPGMGKLIIDSINVLDRPVIVAFLMLTVTMFIVINLIVDIAYSFLDPRIRLLETSS